MNIGRDFMLKYSLSKVFFSAEAGRDSSDLENKILPLQSSLLDLRKAIED